MARANVTGRFADIWPEDAQVEGYFPISLESLRVDTLPAFSIYLPRRSGSAPVLYREKNLPFTEDVRQRLLDHGVQYALVPADDEQSYRHYVEQNLGAILTDPVLPLPVKTELLYRSATNLMEEVFAAPRAGSVIPRSRAFVASTCEFLRSESRAFQSLLKVTSYDYYTYTHSVNVFVFSTALAQRVGFESPRQLAEYGEGALLHDIGKSMVAPEIINCRGKLNPEQWAEMKRHPAYGCEILESAGIRDERVLDVVRHHHEKLTGSGYPDGLKGSEIHTFTRICTIADIFDALTTDRPYKAALKSYPALELMMREMSEEVDQMLLRTFIEMMCDPEDE